MSDHKGVHSQESQQDSVEKKLQPNLQPHLLSPEDLVGKWSHQTAGGSSDLNYSSCVSSSNTCKTASQLRKMYGRQGSLVCLYQEVKNISHSFLGW